MAATDGFTEKKARRGKRHGADRASQPYQSRDKLDVQIIDAEEVQARTASADSGAAAMEPATKPDFAPLTAAEMNCGKTDYRRVPVPAHRLTPLKDKWAVLYEPIATHMKLQVRFNVKTRQVELRTSEHTTDSGALQKGADFIKAFILGFEVQDAIALLRMDELYLETFEVKDVKSLHGDHMSRAIGRIAGKDGKTKFAIENATKTRIVIADSKVHLLGSFSNIKIARDAICDLILGSPPSKVYTKLRAVAARLKERL